MRRSGPGATCAAEGSNLQPGDPSITRTAPATASSSTVAPSGIAAMAPAQPMSGGEPELAGDDRGVRQRAALLGDHAAGGGEDGVPRRAGTGGDDDVAGLEAGEGLGRVVGDARPARPPTRCRWRRPRGVGARRWRDAEVAHAQERAAKVRMAGGMACERQVLRRIRATPARRRPTAPRAVLGPGGGLVGATAPAAPVSGVDELVDGQLDGVARVEQLARAASRRPASSIARRSRPIGHAAVSRPLESRTP